MRVTNRASGMRPFQRASIVLFLYCLAGPTAWSAESQSGVTRASVKMHGAVNAMGERCEVFKQGGLVSFNFTSIRPLDFNIHFHTKTDTGYPIQLTETLAYKGQFLAEPKIEYCFMWQNQHFSADKWMVDLEYKVLPLSHASR